MQQNSGAHLRGHQGGILLDQAGQRRGRTLPLSLTGAIEQHHRALHQALHVGTIQHHHGELGYICNPVDAKLPAFDLLNRDACISRPSIFLFLSFLGHSHAPAQDSCYAPRQPHRKPLTLLNMLHFVSPDINF